MKPSMTRTLMCATLLPACSAILFSQRRAAPSAYPVSKVVDLLRDMKAQLEKEGEADEEIYEKMACWCETNHKEKTKAISDAEVHLTNLQATIEKNIALSATLKVEIDGLETEIDRNVKSLEVATALRTKQKADFIAEEKEMVQSIQALGAAVTVISKHHGGGSEASSALATIRTQLQRHGELLRGVITPRQRRTLSAFVQASSSGASNKDHFDSTPKFNQAYAPQSGEIFGILRQMKATFETDLSQSQTEEVASQEAYTALKAAKEEEIKTGRASLEDKKGQLAKADETVAQSKADREDTQATMDADQVLLSDLVKKCSMTDEEWEKRQKLRQGEIAAVAEAIGILSSDDARDLFSKNFNRDKAASFLQVGRSADRERAAGLLAAAAAKSGDPKLSALATSTKLDTFVRVKKAIDDMVAQLTQEKADEVKDRDLCISELNTNEKSNAKELHTKKNQESEISTLELKVEGFNNTINALKSEIEELNLGRERARENRELERAEYEKVLGEQEQSESLLQQALTVLKSRYAADEEGGALLQHAQGSKMEPAPKGFSTYKKSGQSPGVLALIEHIIQGCQQMQKESKDAEAAARDAYTQFVEETTKAVEAKEAAVVDRTSDMSAAEQDLQRTKSELSDTMNTLETLSTGLADLKKSCDYLLKNFETRQEARDQEVEALRQAKAYLSGME